MSKRCDDILDLIDKGLGDTPRAPRVKPMITSEPDNPDSLDSRMYDLLDRMYDN